MLPHHLLANYRHRFVGRKIVAVIIEHEQIQRWNQPVGGIARSYINLTILQRRSEQTQVHDAGRRGKVQAIGGSQPGIPIRPLHELVAESCSPLRTESRSLRQGLEVQTARVFPTNFHRESIVKTKRRTEGETEARFVFTLDPLIYLYPIASNCLFEDGGQCSARVFGVDVNTPR